MNYLDDIYNADPSAQRYDGYLSLFCPYHMGNRRSLMVYEDFFICLSCDEKGHPGKLFKKLQGGITFIPKEVQERRSFSNPWTNWLWSESLFQILKKGYQTLKNFPDQRYYLRKRGIPDAEILKLRLGYRESYYLFSIIGKDGKLLGSVARASDSIETSSKYVTPNKRVQDNRNLLYVPDWDLVEQQDKFYLAFGIISAISIYLCGFAAGSPLTGKKVNPEILKDIRKKIVIVPDAKEEKEAIQLANSLGWRGEVLRLPYKEDILDPNDLLLFDKNSLLQNLQ